MYCPLVPAQSGAVTPWVWLLLPTTAEKGGEAQMWDRAPGPGLAESDGGGCEEEGNDKQGAATAWARLLTWILGLGGSGTSQTSFLLTVSPLHSKENGL